MYICYHYYSIPICCAVCRARSVSWTGIFLLHGLTASRDEWYGIKDSDWIQRMEVYCIRGLGEICWHQQGQKW